MMPRDRRVAAYGEHRSDRGHLVGVAAIRETAKSHHHEPYEREYRSGDDTQVQPRDNQQMRHAGTCKSLAERLADFAAGADHQRAPPRMFGMGKIGIRRRTYMVSDRLGFTRRRTAATPD